MTAHILLVSPYHGGSHRAWAEGYQAHSGARVSLLTLPARFWKWRMHGGAITLARRYSELGTEPDMILATDMLDVTTFLALAKPDVPLALYMHENQLTYPLPADGHTGPMRRQHGERDLHYAFINFASMLAADRVFFNSSFHRRSFFDALPRFLRHFPEDNELDAIPTLLEKSAVLQVGIRLRWLRQRSRSAPPASSPLILWNQRWEYDKDPAAFFRALYEMQGAGIPFRLALCGENFRQRPREFDEALDRLSPCLVHVGFAPEERYRELLWEADVIVSTARHEFFGISVLEAIACGTFPLLPDRLSYPELIPRSFHQKCLYRDESELILKLAWALTSRQSVAELAAALATETDRFDWRVVAAQYDAVFSEMSAR